MSQCNANLGMEVLTLKSLTAGIESSGLAQAYARARGADRMSSFGDIVALSDEVDVCRIIYHRHV